MDSFEKLLMPFSRQEFDKKFWLYQACSLKPDPGLLEPLMADQNLLDVERLVELGHDNYRILPYKNAPIRQGDGKSALSAWKEERGVTLVAELAQCNLQSVLSYYLGAIKSLGVPFRWCWPNVYYSRPGSGFSRHWDNHENFIVGLSGIKRFLLAPNGCVAYPTQNADNVNPHVRGFEDQIEAERTSGQLPGMFTVDVGPGDCIFIPRGWWHEAEALETDSITLTLAIWTSTWAELLAAGGITPPGQANELNLRTPLPLSAGVIPPEFAAVDPGVDHIRVVRAQAEMLAVSNIIADLRKGVRADLEM
jgi:Cupin-like domain